MTPEHVEQHVLDGLKSSLHHSPHAASIPQSIGKQNSSLRESLRSLSRTKTRTKSWRTMSQSRASVRNKTQDPLALVIDGDCLQHAILLCPEELVRLAEQCKVVLACRVSPAQKAAVVALVKRYVRSSRTLSIGDGANDVPMIQEAHIGVGISGQEGLQAVNASDYALAQFAYLKRLLLVHGRKNYERISKLVMYIIYKNILLILAQFIFTVYAGLSGQKFYLEAGVQLYNILLTSFPVISLAILDHDVRDDIALRLPMLYRSGPLNKHLNYRIFAYWLICAWIEAVTIIIVVVGALEYGGLFGESPSIWFVGNIVLTAVVVTANVRLVFIHHRYFAFSPFFFAASIGAWVVTSLVSSHVYLLSGITWSNMIDYTVTHQIIWISTPLVIITISLYSFLARAITVMLFPSPSDIVKEFVKFQPTSLSRERLAQRRATRITPQVRGSISHHKNGDTLSVMPHGTGNDSVVVFPTI